MEIISNFAIGGTPSLIRPVGNGHINDTYAVMMPGAGDEPQYILQRINHHIFRDVALLQHNIETVTAHIRRKLVAMGVTDPDLRVARLIAAHDGTTFHFDGESYWRVMLYVRGTHTCESLSEPRLAYDTGLAFGDFQSMLCDLPAGSVGESIPDFHNMEFRLGQLDDAIKEDAAGRLASVRDIADRLLERAGEMTLASRLHREGKLPKRITHCDTKVNNILFDRDNRPSCIIDLDTTMEGFVLSDFGDFIRTGANTGDEDDRDLGRVEVDMDIFRAFAEGYIKGTASFLTPIEKELLPFGAKMLTYMQAVRFFTDYLNGDTYYKVHYPEHNLVRTRAQMKLLESIDAHENEMNGFISSIV